MKDKISISIDNDTLAAVDEYRAVKRENRSEAIARLVRIGLMRGDSYLEGETRITFRGRMNELWPAVMGYFSSDMVTLTDDVVEIIIRAPEDTPEKHNRKKRSKKP